LIPNYTIATGSKTQCSQSHITFQTKMLQTVNASLLEGLADNAKLT